ncbi:MAG: hypothetical protein HY808_00515 [Nitrospirae bacterium]|nr:hypothetical protein [Nitrospirota bacterium]
MKRFFYILLLVLIMAPSVHADTPDTNIINIYDANGSLVTGDGNYYEYNDANQLVRVRQGDQNGAVVAEYFYDYSGQRIKKIENGVTTYYIGKHFEKQIGGTDEGNSSYYFAEGERVAKKDPSGNIYYYHADHLGGTNAVTDSAGTVVAKTDYMPFGEVKQGSTGNEKYSYTGKEKDKTDLYYFEARYNSTMFKHFTQADVAEPDFENPQDLNRYAYVQNNPLTYIDPDGLSWKGFWKETLSSAVSLSSIFFNAGMASVSYVTGHKLDAASNLMSAVSEFNETVKHGTAVVLNLFTEKTVTSKQIKDEGPFDTKAWKYISGINSGYKTLKLLDKGSYKNLKNLKQIKNIGEGKFALASFGKGVKSLENLLKALDKGSLGSAFKEKLQKKKKKDKRSKKKKRNKRDDDDD